MSDHATSKRLEILRASLAKKKSKLDRLFDEHFADVKSANGQPLNDKRNGDATKSRWERQSTSIRNLQDSIKLTEDAIERELDKIATANRISGIARTIRTATRRN